MNQQQDQQQSNGCTYAYNYNGEQPFFSQQILHSL
jgi:hypothetical protein